MYLNQGIHGHFTKVRYRRKAFVRKIKQNLVRLVPEAFNKQLTNKKLKFSW